jgi:hypothetical protein
MGKGFGEEGVTAVLGSVPVSSDEGGKKITVRSRCRCEFVDAPVQEGRPAAGAVEEEGRIAGDLYFQLGEINSSIVSHRKIEFYRVGPWIYQAVGQPGQRTSSEEVISYRKRAHFVVDRHASGWGSQEVDDAVFGVDDGVGGIGDAEITIILQIQNQILNIGIGENEDAVRHVGRGVEQLLFYLVHSPEADALKLGRIVAQGGTVFGLFRAKVGPGAEGVYAGGWKGEEGGIEAADVDIADPHLPDKFILPALVSGDYGV